MTQTLSFTNGGIDSFDPSAHTMLPASEKNTISK